MTETTIDYNDIEQKLTEAMMEREDVFLDTVKTAVKHLLTERVELGKISERTIEHFLDDIMVSATFMEDEARRAMSKYNVPIDEVILQNFSRKLIDDVIEITNKACEQIDLIRSD